MKRPSARSLGLGVLGAVAIAAVVVMIQAGPGYICASSGPRVHVLYQPTTAPAGDFRDAFLIRLDAAQTFLNDKRPEDRTITWECAEDGRPKVTVIPYVNLGDSRTSGISNAKEGAHQAGLFPAWTEPEGKEEAARLAGISYMVFSEAWPKINTSPFCGLSDVGRPWGPDRYYTVRPMVASLRPECWNNPDTFVHELFHTFGASDHAEKNNPYLDYRPDDLVLTLADGHPNVAHHAVLTTETAPTPTATPTPTVTPTATPTSTPTPTPTPTEDPVTALVRRLRVVGAQIRNDTFSAEVRSIADELERLTR
jgi:hypothetical protein